MLKALFILFTFALEQLFMRLELQDIKDGQLTQELTCSATDLPVLAEMERDHQVRLTAPVVFHIRLQKSGQLVEVDGQLQARVDLSCGRCLQPFEQELIGDFAFTFTPYVAGDDAEDTDAEIELETDELGLVYYRNETLELLPPLQDQLIMSLPISPLCSDDCNGLCPECGCDLNKTSCQCEKKIFNSKFKALAGLKLESSKK